MIYILTLTWNAAERLSKLHQSLMPALDGLDWTWLIKSNGCKDNTVAMASDWGDRIKVVSYKDNTQNFSEGMNLLFSEASPSDRDMVLLLNNDIIFNDTQSLQRMVDVLQDDSTVGAVGARLLYTNTNVVQHGGVVFHNSHRMPFHFRAGEKTDANAEKNRLFQAVTGAVLLTKAEYYRNACTTNKSGNRGLDEQFRWSFDDTDFCLAIRYNMDKRVVYCGQTDISHEESVTLKKNPVNKLFLTHNVSRLTEKWGKRYILDRNSYLSDPKHNLYIP
jgi:GT2 family glycosyltransferase